MVALLLFFMLILYLAQRRTGWQSGVLADIAAVFGATAAFLWISHDCSDRIGGALDHFFIALDNRAVSVFKGACLVFSVAVCIVVISGLYLAFIVYVSKRGLPTVFLVSIGERILFLGVAVGVIYFMERRLRSHPDQAPLPRPLDKLFTLAAYIIGGMCIDKGGDSTTPVTSDEAMFGIFFIVIIVTYIIIFFPVVLVALAVNAVLLHMITSGWRVLSAPVLAAEAFKKWGEARSITHAVVFVLTVIAVAVLALSLVFKYGYGI